MSWIRLVLRWLVAVLRDRLRRLRALNAGLVSFYVTWDGKKGRERKRKAGVYRDELERVKAKWGARERELRKLERRIDEARQELRTVCDHAAIHKDEDDRIPASMCPGPALTAELSRLQHHNQQLRQMVEQRSAVVANHLMYQNRLPSLMAPGQLHAQQRVEPRGGLFGSLLGGGLF